MKASLVLVLCIALVVAGIVAISMQKTSLQRWAEEAPMEKKPVKYSGVNVEVLIKGKLPRGMSASGDIVFAADTIGRRQGKRLGTLHMGEEFYLPVPYDEWREQ